MIKKYILGIVMILSVKGICQTNYTVNPIPFQQFIGTLPIQFVQDDVYSASIPLPFTFNFYGIDYNNIQVSSNGHVNFTILPAGTFAPWSFNQTIPNVNFPVKNSILGAFHDLNNATNAGAGFITYGIYGTAPYRKFVVIYNNVPHFSCNTSKISTFQIVLFESKSIVDVQLIDKQTCITWNGGRTVTGLINIDGSLAITPPNRNTGPWTAFHEGWRFSRPGYYVNYPFTVCDDDTDGIANFDLTVVQNDLASFNPTLYEDAALTIPITNVSAYTNTSNPQTIYAAGNGQVKNVILSVIDCTVDYDNDTVSTSTEDVNLDTNLANDDTDDDGLPNYLDNDDDGDLILSNVEYVFSKTNNLSINALVDTDSDTIPNYLDNDDDGDGILTFKEDYNGDGNPINDDTNSNSIPDYLENGVALGVVSTELQNLISLYPNPTSNTLFIDNPTDETITTAAIYTINGSLVKNLKDNAIESISVSDLQTGIYFVKLTTSNQTLNYKFIKN